jgi:hypothetical protein
MPSVDEILNVNGVGDGSTVNVACTVGGTFVGVSVLSTSVGVAGSAEVGTGVTCVPHAEINMDRRKIDFFINNYGTNWRAFLA